MEEDRLQLAVFIDFDNIEIGVKTTLNNELDLALVLDALRERGEVVSKSAYGDWARAGNHSRTLTDHAVHMVQRNVTPRGDKNGADINLVVDALEMAFTRPHINAFAIVGGDSDFIALVEKLKQFGKRVLVVGGRSFTSGTLQRNCHEFIAYENLLSGGRRSQQQSRGPVNARLPLKQGFDKVQRALKVLADRGVQPQLGPLKSTLLQLDPTFSERDYGTSSFREFIQRLENKKLLTMRRIDQGYLVEVNGEAEAQAAQASEEAAGAAASGNGSAEPAPVTAEPRPRPVEAPRAPASDAGGEGEPAVERSSNEAVALLRRAVEKLSEARPGKPTYVRHLAQALRSIDPDFNEERYGFRTLTELMHLGQREGIVRMQRDRQGAWRVTPMSSEGGEAGSPRAVEEPIVDETVPSSFEETTAARETADEEEPREAFAAERVADATDEDEIEASAEDATAEPAVGAEDAEAADGAATTSRRGSGRRKTTVKRKTASKSRSKGTSKTSSRASRDRKIGDS